MYISDLDQTRAKFKIDPAKMVRGVAFTKLDTILMDSQMDAQGKALCVPTLTGRRGEIRKYKYITTHLSI